VSALTDIVAAYVQDHPDRTVEEIALAVGRRRSDVQQALKFPLFTRLPGPRNSTVYRFTGRAGTAPETDCAFLLRMLSDGVPRTLNDIIGRSFKERGCGLTVHSRAADLRRQGFNVVNWKDGVRGDGSWYQLRPLEEAAPGSEPLTSPSAAVSSSGRGTDGSLLVGAIPAAQQDGQLVLDGREFRRRAAA